MCVILSTTISASPPSPSLHIGFIPHTVLMCIYIGPQPRGPWGIFTHMCFYRTHIYTNPKSHTRNLSHPTHYLTTQISLIGPLLLLNIQMYYQLGDSPSTGFKMRLNAIACLGGYCCLWCVFTTCYI